jgi:hypothetical protein
MPEKSAGIMRDLNGVTTRAIPDQGALLLAASTVKKSFRVIAAGNRYINFSYRNSPHFLYFFLALHSKTSHYTHHLPNSLPKSLFVFFHCIRRFFLEALI